MPDEQVPQQASGDPGVPWQPPAWPQPPAPPQPPARRSHARTLGLLALVAFVVALIAASVGYEFGSRDRQTGAAAQHSQAGAPAQNVQPGVCPAGESEPAPSATSPAGTALLSRVLPVPPGDQQVTVLKQGVLSLRDYMNELYPDKPAEQAAIAARCFQAAVHRTWVTPGGTTTSVWLIQFATRADARSYTLAVELGDSDAAAAHTARFTVAGVADGIGLADPNLDSAGNTLTRLLGDAGNTSIIIHVFIPAQTDNAASSRVLRAQSARLGLPTGTTGQ